MMMTTTSCCCCCWVSIEAHRARVDRTARMLYLRWCWQQQQWWYQEGVSVAFCRCTLLMDNDASKVKWKDGWQWRDDIIGNPIAGSTTSEPANLQFPCYIFRCCSIIFCEGHWQPKIIEHFVGLSATSFQLCSMFCRVNGISSRECSHLTTFVFHCTVPTTCDDVKII